MNLKPIADLLAHFSWSELVSAVLAAGIVAVVNIISNHKLAKKRDKENRVANDEMQIARDKLNREGNEEIQRKAEIRQYRTAEDDRRDADNQREQKERLQSVRSYYIAYTEALRRKGTFVEQVNYLMTATRIFRLEAIALDSEMEKQSTKILTVMDRMEEFYESLSIPNSQRARKVLAHMTDLQEALFAELMIWGLHGKSHKFGKLMDNNLAEVDSW